MGRLARVAFADDGQDRISDSVGWQKTFSAISTSGSHTGRVNIKTQIAK
jgi:hypothetical protein